MRKTKILKKATSFVLAVIMVLSCMTAGLSVIAMASDWVYIAGQSGRVARTLYIKADQLWNGYTGLIGGSNYIIDENGNSKAVTVGQSGGATKYYTSADGNDTWWAWTNYVLADAEIEHCAVTRTNNNTLYNSYSGKYIVNNGSSITSSTGSSAWTFANNQIYCSSGYMYENSNGIALRSSSSQIYAYTNPTTVYVDVESSGGYYRYAGPNTYELTAGQDFTFHDVENDAVIQYKTSASASNYQTLSLADSNATITWDKTLNANSVGTYTATVKIGSSVLDTIVVTVKSAATDPVIPDDPNAGDGLPVFPADGSVKVDKWATGEHLKETGVGEVSLSVTAVPPIYSFGVDVVFVTDVSNSMAWVAGTTRAPGSGETSKLQDMQKAVSDFSEVFLSNNIAGNIRGNNTVTFTTFGGWDADVTSTSYEYTDPTRTLFIANRDIDDIKSKVNAITFNMPESNTYYLTFNGQKSTNSSDRNYGGTNYDVGMMQAYNAINNVKSEYYTQTGENYDSTSRQIYVIFVTDGAPTLYNGLQYKPVGSSSPAGTMVYTDPNTNKQYSYNGYNGTNDVTQAQWYNYIKSTDHAWATKVYNMDHVTNMSCIGIDFPNGGFQANTDYWIFTKAEGYPLENVLSGIVTNQTLDVGLAEDQLELAENLASIAKEVSSMSEGSYTIDLMGTNFDLQRASTVTDANGNVIKLSDYGITPTIKVMRYPTYHKSDVGTRMNGVTVTESMIGQYYGTPSVIETVTFSADGTQAFSDRKSGNILKNGIIDASFFTYNTTDHDVVTEKGKVLTPKSFLWYLGTLSEDEIRLTYNVYLDGSMEGEREEGSFATNNEAKLYYKDYKGVQREKTYPVPYLPWDEAKLAYELYLVDTDGNPINLNGDKVSFENREVMSELQTVEAYLNTSYEIDYDLLQKILPEGYYLYNEDSSFDIFMASGSHGEAKVNDDTKTTIVSIPEDATTDTNGNVKASQYNDVKVSFAIIKLQINPDVVVLDYGKTILSDPLANDNGSFVINGLTTTPPASGKKTSDTVKLSNGVAKVLDGTVDKNTIVPLGKNVVTPFALSGTNYVYPEIGKVTSSNNTGAARYVVESNGKITKYAAGSTSGTQLAASLENGDYVIDGSYAITNLKGTLYIVKDYQLDSKTIETKVERTYYELGNTVSSTRSISNDSNNKTVLATLPDGTVVSAYYQAQTSGFWWSQTTTYYIYLYFGNTSIGSFSSSSASYNDYTYKNMKDINGNDITVNITFSRSNNTTVTVSYPSVTEKTTTDTTTETVNVLKTGYKTENEMVEYTPFQYMSNIDTVYYYVSLSSKPAKGSDSSTLLYSTIKFIPATTVYYEDDFGGSEENGGLYIKYTGNWTSIDDNGNKVAISANTNTNDRQDRGEIGEGHVPYGYDSSYNDCTKFSNGTATVVKGSISKDANGKNQFDAYAEFTFTGTGFDIISRTDMDCGTISVAVYDTDNELIANVPVINKGVENLYQIPVISFTGLSYDTYKVKINVNAPQKLLGITGSTFYLDAIRIYDPMGLSNRDNAEFNEAYEAYYTDKESNAFIGSIRDYILSIEDLGVDEEAGAVYVDTIDNDYSGGGVLKKDDLEEFHISGPNEEVYLTPGKGVGFALVCSALPSSVQLEIKIPAPLSNEANLLAQTNGKPATKKEITVHSASEMFYDITDAVEFVPVQKAGGTYYRAVVILSNGLAGAENDIVSITNVKLTYPESVRNIVEGKDEDKIVTSGETSMVIDENGDIIEAPTQVAVGVMASWNIYCDVFDTIYTQHQATVPTYNVNSDDEILTAAYGKKITATFTTSQFVDDLVITDADGKAVKAEITSVVDEDNLYTASYESAKTWTVTFNNNVGVYNYTVSAANGEGETAEITVNVKPTEAVSVSVLKAPAKTQYSYGDEIDASGLELLVTYSDGTTKVVKSGYTLSTYKADKSGKRSVIVNYQGLQTSYKINVKVSFAQVILTIFGLGWLWK